MINTTHFPQGIIISLLDLFLVCRWRGHDERRTDRGTERRGHQLERYKRVRRNRESFLVALLPLFASSRSRSVSVSLSKWLKPRTGRRGRRCHRRDTDYKLHSIYNEVHLFWRPTLVARALGSARF